MPLNDAHIKEVVRETVPLVLALYGVDVTDPAAAQADMAYLRRRRVFEERFTLKTRLTIVAVVVSSAVTGLIFVIKETFNIGT